jgi:hypothetical protein
MLARTGRICVHTYHLGLENNGWPFPTNIRIGKENVWWTTPTRNSNVGLRNLKNSRTKLWKKPWRKVGITMKISLRRNRKLPRKRSSAQRYTLRSITRSLLADREEKSHLQFPALQKRQNKFECLRLSGETGAEFVIGLLARGGNWDRKRRPHHRERASQESVAWKRLLYACNATAPHQKIHSSIWGYKSSVEGTSNIIVFLPRARWNDIGHNQLRNYL